MRTDRKHTDPRDSITAALHHVRAEAEPLLVAVSGGADSMVLMHAASRAAPGRVGVVHVHHGLRATADRDADFVQRAAEELGLPFHRVEAPPGPGHAARTETAARDRRMAAFTHTARALDVRLVLLAHHLDDELETMLLHRERGHSGHRAQAGIPTVRSLSPFQGDGRPFLLRPFCTTMAGVDRAGLRTYARRHGVRHVEDETNAAPDVPRNRIRAGLARRSFQDIARLLETRGSARGHVSRRVDAARRRLARGLHEEGLGSRLDRVALEGDDEDRKELLRLLGGCLARPRRIDPRGTLLRRLREPAVGGQLLLPAAPRPVSGRFSRSGLHLPEEALAPGTPDERLHQARLRTSLYL